jgi:hypothetical protein
MKSILFGFVLSAALLCAFAEDEAKPKEGDIKIYKRLIPADVLRGEFASASQVMCVRSGQGRSHKSQNVVRV